jgi:hypothetical protein
MPPQKHQPGLLLQQCERRPGRVALLSSVETAPRAAAIDCVVTLLLLPTPSEVWCPRQGHKRCGAWASGRVAGGIRGRLHQKKCLSRSCSRLTVCMPPDDRSMCCTCAAAVSNAETDVKGPAKERAHSAVCANKRARAAECSGMSTTAGAKQWRQWSAVCDTCRPVECGVRHMPSSAVQSSAQCATPPGQC